MDYKILEEYVYYICYLKYNDFAIAKLIQEYCMEKELTTVKNPISNEESTEADKYFRPATFNASFWRLNIESYDEGNGGIKEVLKLLKNASIPIFSNINPRLNGFYRPYTEMIRGTIITSCQLKQIDIESPELQPRIDESTHELIAANRLTTPPNMYLKESLLAQKCLEIVIAASGCETLFKVDRINYVEGIAQKYD